jgi:hypothetical protein
MFRVLWFDCDGQTIDVIVSDGIIEVAIMADIAFEGRVASLTKCHVQGAGANTVGPAALRRLIRAAKEYFDVDELRIAGALRTSGAGPGRIPGVIVF